MIDKIEFTGVFVHYLLINFASIFSGISSVVRRCIDKETGKEYAAKIIDLGASESSDSNQMLESTRQEISILRQVMGHPYLSEQQFLIALEFYWTLFFQSNFKMCSNQMPLCFSSSSSVVMVNSLTILRRWLLYRRKRHATLCDRSLKALTIFTREISYIVILKYVTCVCFPRDFHK